MGTVTLTITETASSPGDPTQALYYRSIPQQTATQSQSLAQFPSGFAVSDLTAEPLIVNPGASTTLLKKSVFFQHEKSLPAEPIGVKGTERRQVVSCSRL